jgi:NADPH:quinone reductase-like Zn-dependent oxidoreductase/SAM-dependent methyltransferase
MTPEIEQLTSARGWSAMLSGLTGPLDHLSIAYIVQALDELGWEAAPGARIGFDALSARLSVAAQHRPLMRGFLKILAKEGYLAPAGPDTWEVRRALPREDPRALWQKTLARLPEAIAELTLIGACGSRLAAILKGEADPLQSLFPDGSTTTVEHFFQDAPALVSGNVIVQRIVRRALDALPTDRVLRILELGAGTGGLTSYVLPELAGHRTDYIFSDVSPFFLAKAQPRFRDYPFVRFQLLDVEGDPRAQGLASHGFDLILAANVLHATRDLRESLGHVRELLAPDGLLALVEIDEAPPWSDLVFGITEGWWRFSDLDLRPEHPLLARRAWQTLLASLGWTEVACMAVPLAAGKTSGHFVLVGRGPSLPSAEPTAGSARPPAEPGSWVIFADRGGVGEQLAERLKAGGDTCWTVTPGEGFRHRDGERAEISPAEPEDMKRLLESVTAPGRAPLRGAIHLWSLDAPPAAATTTASLQRAEALGCHCVMRLVQAFFGWDALPEATHLVLVTRGAQGVGERPVAIGQAPLVGLGRTLIHEYPDLRCKLVDLDPDPTPEEITALIAELWTEDPNEEIVLRRGERFVPRLERMSADAVLAGGVGSTSASATPYRLEPPPSGVLTSMTLRATSRQRPGRGQVEIEVAAAALNFRDVMKALRLYPGDAEDSMVLGDECAGIIAAVGEDVEGVQVGDEVVAIAPGSFASHVITAAGLVLRKPAHLTFAAAAGMPVAFLTAYYGLHHLARIGAGERVLIHAAAGGVGLAAVQLARLADAEVWATAGNPEKRALLTRLGVRHVMDSRSLAFFDQIMEETAGQGVDIVLNSLAGPALAKSMACLGPHGRFVELGKRDIYGNSKIGLRPFRKHIALFAVDLGAVIADRPALIRAMLGDLLQHINTGAHRGSLSVHGPGPARGKGRRVHVGGRGAARAQWARAGGVSRRRDLPHHGWTRWLRADRGQVDRGARRPPSRPPGKERSGHGRRQGRGGGAASQRCPGRDRRR